MELEAMTVLGTRLSNGDSRAVEDVYEALGPRVLSYLRRRERGCRQPVWAREVRRGLDRLPAEQREVLELAYFGGRTQVEIASQLGLPLGTVKARMFRGLRRMGHTMGIRRQ